MTEFVFNVYFPDDAPDEEPTLFARREDAEEYASIFAKAVIEEVTVMDQGLAAGFISEARSDIDAETEDPR